MGSALDRNMIHFRNPVLALLMTLPCWSAEIVAWKVPLSRFVQNGLKSEGAVRCKAAPEASPFFKEGDELWDLKEAKPYGPDNQKVSPDWVIWDATSGRLVVKADWADICKIQEIILPYDLPQHCRLTMNLYEVAADGAPLLEDAKPLATMSMVARSGLKYEASWNGDGKKMEVEGDATFGPSETAVDVLLHISAEVSGQPRMEVNTAFTLQPGKALWVARDFDGKKGLDLSVSGVIESLDGVPYRERMMIQKMEKAVPLIPESLEMQRAGEEGWFVSRWVSPRDLMEQLSPGSAHPVADPFAVPSQEDSTVLPSVPTVSPPEFLSPWLDHEVLDARAWVEKIAPYLKNGENFIGYDPLFERLYFYSPKQGLAESFDQAFTPFCSLPWPKLIAATVDGKRQTRLVAKSGQKASLTRNSDEKSELLSMEIEPTSGENDEIIDMRLDYSDEENPNATTCLKTSATLTAGKPLELLSGATEDGGKSSLRLKAEILSGNGE